MLPYYPQEHYCDKPEVPANKRANIIAGVSGLQAILFGMAGIEPELSGSLVIHPQPPEDGFIEIKGFRHKDLSIDLLMKTGFMKVSANDKIIYEGEPKKIVL